MNHQFIDLNNINIMYIHGYNSDHNSTTSKLLYKSLNDLSKDTFTYHSPDIPNDIHLAIIFIRQYVQDHQIDLIIASSLGAFKLLYSDLSTDIKKILINPLISVDTLKMNIIDDIILAKCNEIYQSKSKVKDDNLASIFSLNDEVIDHEKSVELFKEYNENESSVYYIDDVHKVRERVDDIASIVVIIILLGGGG